MECLSLLLQICEEAQLKKVPYFKDGVSVSHLLFADDLMIFPNPDIHSVQNLTLALQDFHTYSGLPVNFLKCNVFCSAISSALKAAILSILGMHEEQLPLQGALAFHLSQPKYHLLTVVSW